MHSPSLSLSLTGTRFAERRADPGGNSVSRVLRKGAPARPVRAARWSPQALRSTNVLPRKPADARRSATTSLTYARAGTQQCCARASRCGEECCCFSMCRCRSSGWCGGLLRGCWLGGGGPWLGLGEANSLCGGQSSALRLKLAPLRLTLVPGVVGDRRRRILAPSPRCKMARNFHVKASLVQKTRHMYLSR